MLRQWEEFPVGERERGSDYLRVTLSRKGEIMLGAAAFEKLGRPEAAVLLYDRRNKAIGIAAAEADAPNIYPLKEKKGARHRILRANMFCRHYGISVERTTAFTKAEIDEDGVLVLDLRSLVGLGKILKG